MKTYNPLELRSTEELSLELESLIDRSSLHAVLEALTNTCSNKAEHLRTQWNDRATARLWDRAAAKLSAVSWHFKGVL